MCFVKTNGFKHLLKYWKIVQTQELNHKTQNISVVCVCIYTERDKLKEKLVIMIIYHSKMLFILNKVWLSFLYHEYLSCCYYGIVFW